MFDELASCLPQQSSPSAGTTSVAACSRCGLAWPKALFVSAWLFIGAVSVYDAWLVLLYRVCILEEELNPICRYIMRNSDPHMTGFFLAKAGGTTAVLSILLGLNMHSPRLASPIIAVVAAFQAWLLLFLTFA